jgi:hypothetical protein
MAASDATPKYDLPFPKPTDIVDVAGDIRLLAINIDENIDEIIQDAVGGMVVGNLEDSGIDAIYDDTSGKLNLSLNVNYIQDEVAKIFTHNAHSNITATYDDQGSPEFNNRIILTASGGGSGSSGGSSLTDAWWLGV